MLKTNIFINALPLFYIEPPTFVEKPALVNATAGSDVTFTCVTNAVPSAAVTWYRNDNILDPGKPWVLAGMTYQTSKIADTLTPEKTI